MKLQLLLAISIYTTSALTLASNEHPHDVKQQAVVKKKEDQIKEQHEEEEHKEDNHHEGAHTDDKPHHDDHASEHDQHEETKATVSKGITEANEKDGFKISAQAEKNFEIERKKLSAKNTIEIQKSAIVTAGTEINLYRYRAGFYKRIDFDTLKTNGSAAFISSKDLAAGDEIVTKGMGFLRIAELAAFGGAPEGHSH